MVTIDTYTFIEKKDDPNWYVKIKEGEYKDIIYKYGKIGLVEDKAEDTARLQFQFHVEKIPENLAMTEEELNEDVEFLNILGAILTHIIEDAMDSGKYKLGNDDKSTDSESTVHE
jgi:hypothetical protein